MESILSTRVHDPNENFLTQGEGGDGSKQYGELIRGKVTYITAWDSVVRVW